MDAITQGLINLRKAYVKAPYTLVVYPETYRRIPSVDTGYPLVRRIENLIGGEIVLDENITIKYNLK